MVIIRFDEAETERSALDYLVGRYPFKTWANGDLMVPESALGSLAVEGHSFEVKGPATYEHFLRRYEILLPRRFNDGFIVTSSYAYSSMWKI
jgi:hypothetical protein